MGLDHSGNAPLVVMATTWDFRVLGLFVLEEIPLGGGLQRERGWVVDERNV